MIAEHEREGILDARDASFKSESLDIATRLQAIAARMNRDCSKKAAELGLSLPAARLLSLLAARDNARCSTLANDLGIDPPTLSHVLRTLSDRDLISRERARDDNRAVEVRLTPHGRDVANQCRAMEVSTHGALVEGFSDLDTTRFLELLARMEVNFNACDPRAAASAPARHAALTDA
jgi:DNA-binding MarR family transcriptional regulator